MTTNQDFDQGQRRFWGEKHFPHGLSRSGEFSIDQARLLERHGYAYQELASGIRTAKGLAEKQFVAVCQGSKAPETAHEKAWKRYCDVVVDLSERFTLSLGSAYNRAATGPRLTHRQDYPTPNDQ